MITQPRTLLHDVPWTPQFRDSTLSYFSRPRATLFFLYLISGLVAFVVVLVVLVFTSLYAVRNSYIVYVIHPRTSWQFQYLLETRTRLYNTIILTKLQFIT